MTSTLIKLPVYFALALCTLLTAGCVKYKQIITLMPDGSGKIQYIVGISEEVQQNLDDDDEFFDQFSPDIMKERAQGVAAYTEPVRYKEGDFNYVTYSAYFNNINEVLLLAPEVTEQKMTYKFEKADDGSATLTVNGGVLQWLAKDIGPLGAEELKEIQTLEGLELTEQYVLPGEAEVLEGAALLDNTATLLVDVEALLKQTGPLPALKGKESYTFKIPEVALDEEVVEAFKAEMAAAVEKWQAKQQEAGE